MLFMFVENPPRFCGKSPAITHDPSGRMNRIYPAIRARTAVRGQLLQDGARMMDLSSMSQVSTLVPEPAPTPSAKPAAAAPAAGTAGGGSGNQSAGNSVDQVQVSQPAADAPEPWVDRTPTEPSVDRSFPETERGQRFDFGV